MEGQITDLNTRLQQKEGQIVRIRKDMYDLQESIRNNDRDAQAKDLNLSMTQQKMTEEKIKEDQVRMNALQATNSRQALDIKNLKTELALALQQLRGMPSSDEIEFLRTGLKKATGQLKQKDEMLSQTKANADEYKKEFTAQSLEFKSLKDQLQDAGDEINRRNEDLKYKKLELARFKEQAAIKESVLLGQVRALTHKLEAADKKLRSHAQGNIVEEKVVLPSGDDARRKKLKEALDKINEQGQMINALAQKLQGAGLSVDLTRNPAKK